MTKERWREIGMLIEQDIRDAVLMPGARLPTELELARIYNTGRHSVRRAIAELAKAGHLSVEQGRGTFVQPRPQIEYAIGRRTRIRRNLDAQGIDVSGAFLGAEKVAADEKIAQRLGLQPGAPIIVTRRITYADGIAVSFGAMHHDAMRFADFPQRREVMGSVSAVYASYGISDFLRGTTEIHARPARMAEAQTLKQHPDMPVMVVRAVDREHDGTPLAYTEVIWSAARVKFSITHEEETP
jgi:GntR family phosphonate transport system transcriptional regulator